MSWLTVYIYFTRTKSGPGTRSPNALASSLPYEENEGRAENGSEEEGEKINFITGY